VESTDFAEIGTAVAADDSGMLYTVQHFGKPTSRSTCAST
jgi:hypothetical protein